MYSVDTASTAAAAAYVSGLYLYTISLQGVGVCERSRSQCCERKPCTSEGWRSKQKKEGRNAQAGASAGRRHEARRLVRRKIRKASFKYGRNVPCGVIAHLHVVNIMPLEYMNDEINERTQNEMTYEERR